MNAIATAEWDAPINPRDHAHCIGMRLYAIRMEYGCTLNHLSYRTGISRQLLQHIEDVNDPVDYSTVERIADAFGMNMDEFLNFCSHR